MNKITYAKKLYMTTQLTFYQMNNMNHYPGLDTYLV